MRIKFIILLAGMIAYGYYLHGFTIKAELATHNLVSSYQQVIDMAAKLPDQQTGQLSIK